jgi:hypothetical protein
MPLYKLECHFNSLIMLYLHALLNVYSKYCLDHIICFFPKLQNYTWRQQIISLRAVHTRNNALELFYINFNILKHQTSNLIRNSFKTTLWPGVLVHAWVSETTPPLPNTQSQPVTSTACCMPPQRHLCGLRLTPGKKNPRPCQKK